MAARVPHTTTATENMLIPAGLLDDDPGARPTNSLFRWNSCSPGPRWCRDVLAGRGRRAGDSFRTGCTRWRHRALVARRAVRGTPVRQWPHVLQALWIERKPPR